MEEKIRCQSCGMPLGNGFYGKNADGSENQDYCSLCYQNGQFTQPVITLEQMINRSIENMTRDLHFPYEKARELATGVIPTLKRWSMSPH